VNFFDGRAITEKYFWPKKTVAELKPVLAKYI
jgi:hypothetical protein